MTVEDIPANSAIKGVRVTKVEPAARLPQRALQPGDIITEAGGKLVASKADYDGVMSQADMQRGIMLMINRNGQPTYSILKF